MKLTKDDLDAIRDLISVTIQEVGVTKEEFKEQLKHLPTKEEFYKSQDEIMTELKAMREEHVVGMHQVQRNTKRIEKIEDKLHTSSV